MAAEIGLDRRICPASREELELLFNGAAIADELRLSNTEAVLARRVLDPELLLHEVDLIDQKSRA